MPDELTPSKNTWHDGSSCVQPDSEIIPVVELSQAEWETLSPPVIKIDSLACLTERKKASNEYARWREKVAQLSSIDTRTLILKVGTAQDPLTLWFMHVELDQRNIAPCLRWPANWESPQMEMISWMADLLWFVKRNPHHRAKFRAWQRLLREVPASDQWLETAYRIFIAMYMRQNVSSYTARGLALEHVQRYDLMMLPTSRMRTARLELQPSAFEQTRAKLLTYAFDHPDKSGVHKPDTLAKRRASLWRVHVLSGKNAAETARSWAALTGEGTSRQVVARQIATIEAILKERC
jgi:hypothetical protein